MTVGEVREVSGSDTAILPIPNATCGHAVNLLNATSGRDVAAEI